MTGPTARPAVVYIDTSVALAQLLAEDRCPPASVWDAGVVSSRLTEYEVWTRLHARGLGVSHGEAVRRLLGRFAWLELKPAVLARALDKWPIPMRTLDALHLSSVEFLQRHGQNVTLATYDERMVKAAHRLAIPLVPLA